MKRLLVDVNCFAINLVEDHPGYSYVEPFFSDAQKDQFKLVVLDIVPFRAYWILTKKWDCDKEEAENTIRHFLKEFSGIEFLGLSYEAIVNAFELARVLKHNIYDCYYLSGAITSKCHGILTTDTDFHKLCLNLQSFKALSLEYQNPIPLDILKQFSQYKM